MKKALMTTIAAIALLGALPVPGWGDDALRREIVENPTLTYRKGDLSVAAPLETWELVLDNLYLMGQLWQTYKFQPAYRVTRVESTIHVTDPTGIVAEIVQVERSERSRTFLAKGKFDHWAIPSFFTADGVVIYSYRKEGERLVGELNITLRGSNWISRAVMDLFSGILVRRIDNRLGNNWEDTKKIIRGIVSDPERVKKGLPAPLRDDFERVFTPSLRSPGELAPGDR